MSGMHKTQSDHACFLLFPLRVDFHCNFYVRTCVKFTFANRIEAMHERSLASVKVEPRSTSFPLFIMPVFYLINDQNLRA